MGSEDEPEWPYVPCSCGFHHVPRRRAVWLRKGGGQSYSRVREGQWDQPWSWWCALVVFQARAERHAASQAEP